MRSRPSPVERSRCEQELTVRATEIPLTDTGACVRTQHIVCRSRGAAVSAAITGNLRDVVDQSTLIDVNAWQQRPALASPRSSTIAPNSTCCNNRKCSSTRN